VIKKQKEIIELVNLVNYTFGNDAPTINDHWETDLCAIGLQKNDKLIYIAAYAHNDYFYECELLVDDPDVIYIAQDTENNVSKERILEVISDYFRIRPIK